MFLPKYMSRYMSRGFWEHMTQYKPFIAFAIIKEGRFLGTYGVYYRHRRFGADDVNGWTKNVAPFKKRHKELPYRAYTKCLVTRLDKFESRYWVDSAYCSWSDNFDRRAGRQLSLERVLNVMLDPLLVPRYQDDTATIRDAAVVMSKKGGKLKPDIIMIPDRPFSRFGW